MSIRGFQNYTQPLILDDVVTIEGTLNAKNVYVNGVITGAGISTDILGTDNTWEGTNDFQDITTTINSVIGSDFDLTIKEDVDTAVAGYDAAVLASNNTWLLSPTFSVVPPVITAAVPTNPIPSNLLSTIGIANAITTGTTINIPSNLSNTFTGTQTFSDFVGVTIPSLEVPTLINQPASKAFVDGKIEVAGNTLTITILTPGTYSFIGADKASIVKVDYTLYGGSCSNLCGAVVSGTLGNGCGVNGSLLVSIGTTADPAVVYTTQDKSVASSTSFLVSNFLVACAGGACNLNGVLTAGNIVPAQFTGSYGLSVSGSVVANNVVSRAGNSLLAYGTTLGTKTSAGGLILVVQYI
jgi:hypothetical protein